MEVKALKSIDHPNVIKIIDHGTDKYKTNNETKEINYIATELVTRGELFNYIKAEKFSESLARYVFK